MVAVENPYNPKPQSRKGVITKGIQVRANAVPSSVSILFFKKKLKKERQKCWPRCCARAVYDIVCITHTQRQKPFAIAAPKFNPMHHTSTAHTRYCERVLHWGLGLRPHALFQCTLLTRYMVGMQHGGGGSVDDDDDAQDGPSKIRSTSTAHSSRVCVEPLAAYWKTNQIPFPNGDATRWTTVFVTRSFRSCPFAVLLRTKIVTKCRASWIDYLQRTSCDLLPVAAPSKRTHKLCAKRKFPIRVKPGGKVSPAS